MSDTTDTETTTMATTTSPTARRAPALGGGRRRVVFAAMVGAATMGAVSMAWACTPNMGTAQVSPISVARNTTFKFNAQSLKPKWGYKLYFVDSVQYSLGVNCHGAATIFTTKYKQYAANGNVVTKNGMRTNSSGVLDSDFTLANIQPYKAYLPSEYPPDSVVAGPHDFVPNRYPDPGHPVPTGTSVVCGREVNPDGTLNDNTATQHLQFTVT